MLNELKDFLAAVGLPVFLTITLVIAIAYAAHLEKREQDEARANVRLALVDGHDYTVNGLDEYVHVKNCRKCKEERDGR